MFKSVRTPGTASLRLVGSCIRDSIYGWRNPATAGKVVPTATRRSYFSNFAWKGTNTSNTLRSWKGELTSHSSHRSSVQGRRFVSHSISQWGGWTTPTKSATATIPASTRRTFLSDRPSELQGSTPRFTPLEDLCMDALAWTIALGLWYIPFTELLNDDDGESSDGTDRPLEYREDYGPSVSPWYEKPKHPSGDKKKDE